MRSAAGVLALLCCLLMAACARQSELVNYTECLGVPEVQAQACCLDAFGVANEDEIAELALWWAVTPEEIGVPLSAGTAECLAAADGLSVGLDLSGESAGRFYTDYERSANGESAHWMVQSVSRNGCEGTTGGDAAGISGDGLSVGAFEAYVRGGFSFNWLVVCP